MACSARNLEMFVVLCAALLVVAAPARAEDVVPPDSAMLWDNPDSEPRDLVASGNLVFFSADDGVHGRELWRTDGTPEGTWMLKDIAPSFEPSNPQYLRPVGTGVIFAARILPSRMPVHLWHSDGTAEGTVPLLTDEGQVQGPSPDFGGRVLGEMNGNILFSSLQAANQDLMWTTPSPTRPAVSFGITHGDARNSRIMDRCAAEGCQYATVAIDWEPGRTGQNIFLWHVDQESLDTSEIHLGMQDEVAFLGALGSRVILRVTGVHSETGPEPWVSDGTKEGTYLLKDTLPGKEGGLPDRLDAISFKDRLYFVADDGEHGQELWVTDGSVEGTHLFRDLAPGAVSSEPGIFVATKDLLFFQANSEETGHEPWVTDGTPEGTRLTRDIHPGRADANPYKLAATESVVYFSVEEPEHGEELWRSDGTTEGTRLVADIVPGAGSSYPYFKATLGEQIIFTANDGVHGIELWVSDGSAEGTRLLKDIYPTRGPNAGSSPSQLFQACGLLFFVVNKYPYGAELWRSDGTADGTLLVKDIFAGPPSSRAGEFLALRNRLYFAAEDGIRGMELWSTDGTPRGTYRMSDVLPGSEGSNPHELTAISEHEFVFAAFDGKSGVELYFYDINLLTDGHRLTQDINAGPGSSNPRQLTPGPFQGMPGVYFVADDGVHGEELWWVDNDKHFPRLVRDIITNDVPAIPKELLQSPQGLFFTTGTGTGEVDLHVVPTDVSGPGVAPGLLSAPR